MIFPENCEQNGFPDFIFVNPQLGENLGSAARGMLNFGISKLVLVNPREGWLNSQAIARASGAGRLLSEAAIYSDLKTAIAHCSYVFATTARKRGLSKPLVEPNKAIQEAHKMINKGDRVAFLLGPERTGLTNKEITVANAYVTFSTNQNFSSLNLAHSALLLAYEWSKYSQEIINLDLNWKQSPLASQSSKLKLVEMMIEDLENTNYFEPVNRVEQMKDYLRNLFYRLDLTEGEVKTIHRIRKALGSKHQNYNS